jgi:hypothetical protein
MGIARLKLLIYQPIRTCNARNGAKQYFLKSDIVNYKILIYRLTFPNSDKLNRGRKS